MTDHDSCPEIATNGVNGLLRELHGKPECARTVNQDRADFQFAYLLGSKAVPEK
jgi:hypothetical protein